MLNNNNFNNPFNNNLNNQVNNNPVVNNPMLQHYQNLINQFQQPQQQTQQQMQDPRIAEIMEEYKKIPSVAEKIKSFEEFKKETNNLEYEINKGFENYYKAKTDPQYSQLDEIKTLLQQLLKGGNK